MNGIDKLYLSGKILSCLPRQISVRDLEIHKQIGDFETHKQIKYLNRI
jgi:hypothetical protein